MLGNRLRQNSSYWRAMWIAAAVFNFIIGLPIVFATAWTFDLAYGPPGAAFDNVTLLLWRDFGILVALIGVGYYLVSRDINKNRGIVMLGILSKFFDVAVLSYRVATGVANPVALIPAAIDGIFTVLFIAFAYLYQPVATSPQVEQKTSS